MSHDNLFSHLHTNSPLSHHSAPPLPSKSTIRTLLSQIDKSNDVSTLKSLLQRLCELLLDVNVQRLFEDSAIVEILVLKVKLVSEENVGQHRRDESALKAPAALVKSWALKCLAKLIQTLPQMYAQKMSSLKIEQILIQQLQLYEDSIHEEEVLDLLIEVLNATYWLVSNHTESLDTLQSYALGKHLSFLKKTCEQQELQSEATRTLLKHIGYLTYTIKERQETMETLQSLLGRGTGASRLLSGAPLAFGGVNDTPSRYLDPNFEYSPSKMLGGADATSLTTETPMKEVSPIKLQFETPQVERSDSSEESSES